MLTGQALANVYALTYAEELQRIAKVPTRPNVGAQYLGGGWIEIWGSELPPHPTLRATYPNGWTLGGTVRAGKARQYIAKQLR